MIGSEIQISITDQRRLKSELKYLMKHSFKFHIGRDQFKNHYRHPVKWQSFDD